MLDRLSVPRRPLDFEDYIDILRRNFRWIIGPAFAGLVIATAVAFLMQDTFYSQAMIRIVPQQINPELVQNTTNQDVIDRINGMAQTIESRETLTNVINTFGLYKKELKKEPLQDVIDKMKGSITIAPAMGVANITGRNMAAMYVGFSYYERFTAQRVCQDLVSRLLDASTHETLASQTQVNAFLTDEFDRAKQRLDALEQQVADYQTKNAGHLPEEMQMNMQQVNALEGRAAGLSDALTRNTQQRMMLETEMNIAKQRAAAVAADSPAVVAQKTKIAQYDHDIEDTQNAISAMKQRYTDDYPDLQAARDRLAFLNKEREAALKEKPAAAKTDEKTADNTITREGMDAEANVEQLKTQMNANAVEAKMLQRQLAATNAAVSAYEARLQNVPAGAKEYSDLLRDRDLAKAHYNELEYKREKSAVSMDLERNKQGESLELLDAASLPATPSAPKRQMILPIGLVAGLALGLVLVGVREVKDTSLKNLKDARLYTQLSILGSIPLLENDVVVQRRKQAMWVGWAAATVCGLGVIAISVAHYYLSKA